MTFGISATTATLIGAGATLGGAYLSSRASQSAANTQAQASEDALAQQYASAQASIENQKQVLQDQLRTADDTQKLQIRSQIDSLNNQLQIAQQTRDQQIATAREVLGMQQAAYNPYQEAGLAGQNQLMSLLGIGGQPGSANYGKYATAEFTPEMFAQGVDPGYAFRLSEGLKGLDRQAAARGGLISGNALKAASGYAGEQASQEYQNAFNRYQTTRANTLSPYQGLQGVGLNAAQGLAGAAGTYGTNTIGALGGYGATAGGAVGAAGNNFSNIYGGTGGQKYSAYGNYGNQYTGAMTGYGNNASNLMTGMGNAQAAGQVGSANAINQGISGVSNQYYQNQMLGLLRHRQPSSGWSDQEASDFMGSGTVPYR